MASRRLLLLLFLLLTGVARAALPGSAGPYDLTLATDPAVVPVGAAQVLLSVQAAGKPVEGATVTALVRMPGMEMGEKPETARPVQGQPGVYRARASFPMGGTYQVTVKVSGSQGAAEKVFSLGTGQDTGRQGLPGWILPLAVGLAALGLVTWWLRRRPGSFRLRLDRQVLGGLALILLMLAVSVYAVHRFRRPGSMTPLEAQSMQMEMPAPLGKAPVVLARVERGSLDQVVRYAGQAAAFDEQVVSARTTGVVEWMPWYVGDAVSRGQALARLDSSQLEPRLAASRAAERRAAEGRSVAEGERRQQQAELEKARAESRAAQAAAEAAASRVRDARAEVQAASAGGDYRSAYLARSEALAREGALSEEELQRDRSEAADAEARLRTARARLDEAQAQARQAEAEVAAAKASLEAALAASATSSRRVAAAEAGHEEARAQSAEAAAERGYADLSANLDGVVTERLVSPGTLVQPGQVLLQVARVDPIRLQASVAEADLAKVAPGARVRVAPAGGGTVEGRITAVRPAVDPGSRQGLVEAVLPNPDHRFLPGAYVAMEIAVGHADGALLVPSEALVSAAEPAEGSVPTRSRTWVWIARKEGSGYSAFRVQVQAGPSDGRLTALTSGLAEGDLVIASGYQDLHDGDPVMDSAPSRPAPAASQAKLQTATVKVSSEGFTPARLELKAGVPARLTFLRVDENNCGTEVLFPSLGIRKALPLNQPVVVEFTPRSGQSLDFTCGMGMLKGRVVVR